MGKKIKKQLPIELLEEIIPYLDPITLVSFSQTCQTYRQIANINQEDLLQRLLLLELDTNPDRGGHVPDYLGPDALLGHYPDIPQPFLAFRDPCWGNARYACVGCMKLRSHVWFSNHYVESIPMRKPTATSRAANILREPDDLRLRWMRRQAVCSRLGVRPSELWGTHSERRRFTISNFLPKSVNNMPPGFLPVRSLLIQHGSIGDNRFLYDELVGMGRRKRLCVECQRIRQQPRHMFDVHGPLYADHGWSRFSQCQQNDHRRPPYQLSATGAVVSEKSPPSVQMLTYEHTWFTDVPYYPPLLQHPTPRLAQSLVFTSRLYRSNHPDVHAQRFPNIGAMERHVMARCASCGTWKHGMMWENFGACTSVTQPSNNEQHSWLHRELFCHGCLPSTPKTRCLMTAEWRAEIEARGQAKINRQQGRALPIRVKNQA